MSVSAGLSTNRSSSQFPQAHYVWAKDGDVVYQEAGVGVTATIFIDAAARPALGQAK
jgi:hypothetical protein